MVQDVELPKGATFTRVNTVILNMEDENETLVSVIKNFSATKEIAENNTQGCPVDDSTVETVIKALAYFIILIASLAGNIFLIMVIHKNKHLRKSINYFVFNMAVSDLFNPLTIMPTTIAYIISGSNAWKVDDTPLLGDILCKLSIFLPDVSLAVSIESLLLISMDRFVAVVFPFKAKCITPKVRFICIGCSWIVAIAVHAPYFYTFKLVIKPYDNKPHCVSDWGPAFDHEETHKRFVTATFIIFFLVPLCLLAIVYGFIAWRLKKQNKETEQRLSCRQRLRDQQHKKIIRMSVAIIIAFAVCISPLFVFTFTLIFLWNWEAPPICALHTDIPFACLFMLHLWSAVNPCICVIFNKNYRNALEQISLIRNNSRTSAAEGSRRMQTRTTTIYLKRLSKSSPV